MSNINTPSTNPGSTGSGLGSKLRGVAEVAHGIGDSLRGRAMGAVEGGQKKQENAGIATRGREEVERGMSRIDGRPLPGAAGAGPASGAAHGMGDDIGAGPGSGASGGYDSAQAGATGGQNAAQRHPGATAGAGVAAAGGAAGLEHEKHRHDAERSDADMHE
ncbi:hypothetical protein FA95DRAFT_1680808 [Auriscalpium vulgare]|uniref:Uncharacterized protein n=1 Tax=Auriscalpium vulgare TaxID=40419 RepID=A0ACB8RMV1_9AGAM|nr:hypothetical protein FA95DRAFT_1680808 [Auriscalpium vulgare]